MRPTRMISLAFAVVALSHTLPTKAADGSVWRCEHAHSITSGSEVTCDRQVEPGRWYQVSVSSLLTATGSPNVSVAENGSGGFISVRCDVVAGVTTTCSFAGNRPYQPAPAGSPHPSFRFWMANSSTLSFSVEGLQCDRASCDTGPQIRAGRFLIDVEG